MNQPNKHVLIIDDEPDILELLSLTLNRMGLEVTTAENLAEARQALTDDEYIFCLTDLRLPDGHSLDLVQEIVDQYPNLPVAVITAHGKVEHAVQALKIGAFDFVSKPVDLDILRRLVKTAIKLSSNYVRQKNNDKTNGDYDHKLLERLSGQSEAIQQCREMIVKLSRSQAPVLITGESGSGKELAARLIHDLGPRADGPFIPVNCGAIPTELMESEFFGHTKGSFTGADQNKEGLFQAANGGTLLLDEVADLPINMQVKLLRAIQEKAVRPIGAKQEVPVDVRILSATHQSLKPLVEKGKFRNDLYFRLNVIELGMPGLRERRDDIPELANHFLQQIVMQWGGPKTATITEAAMEALMNHRYTGNVRELVNILQRAVTLCENNEIRTQDLVLEEISLPGSEEKNDLPTRSEQQSLDDYMEGIEKQMLEEALKKARYNKTRAADLLGISFRSLRYKLKKYGID